MDLKIWNQSFRSHAKGGGSTRARAAQTFRALADFADKKGWKGLTPATLTPKQLRIFVEHRAEKIGARSVQNEASHLRRCVSGAGRNLGGVRDPKNSWSSARLGVPSGSRIGGKAAANFEKFEQANLSKQVQAVCGLAFALGLRRQEAVMGGGQLKEWSRELASAQLEGRGAFLALHDGSKGGRSRMIFIHPAQVDLAQKFVSQAKLVYSNGSIIQADSLKQARALVSNELSRSGLTGSDSIHGLRRAFAQRSFCEYRDSGLNEKEALSRLSQDLGHGSGRGRWVWNNYLMGGAGDE